MWQASTRSQPSVVWACRASSGPRRGHGRPGRRAVGAGWGGLGAVGEMGLARAALRHHPAAPVLVVGGCPGVVKELPAFWGLGVRGYLDATLAPSELADAIRTVAAGGTVLRAWAQPASLGAGGAPPLAALT